MIFHLYKKRRIRTLGHGKEGKKDVKEEREGPRREGKDQGRMGRNGLGKGRTREGKKGPEGEGRDQG